MTARLSQDARNPVPACDHPRQAVTEALRGVLPTTSAVQHMPPSIAFKGPVATVADEYRRQLILMTADRMMTCEATLAAEDDRTITLTDIEGWRVSPR